MTRNDQSRAPLEGVRVLDFTQNLPGPYATMLLASLGAEVIKVEPPKGDTARGVGRIFELVNGGKKSVVVDLKDPAARERLLALVDEVDVVIEGFRPGVMDALGFGEAAVRAQSPRCIYCSISAYGQEGPYRDRPGHDLNLQALTGVCDMSRDAEGEPHGAALPIADLSSSMTAVTSVLAALYARERGGSGQSIDVALTDTALSFAYVWGEGLAPEQVKLSSALPTMQRSLRGRASTSAGLRARLASALEEPGTRALADALGMRIRASALAKAFERKRLHALPHYDVFRTADGQHLAIGIVDEDKFWRVLADALGMPKALARIPLPGRFLLGAPLKKLVAAAIARRTQAHWLEVLDLDAVPVSPVKSVYEAVRDPQLTLRRPEGATAAVPPPLAFAVSTRAPALGEHTEALLGRRA